MYKPVSWVWPDIPQTFRLQPERCERSDYHWSLGFSGGAVESRKISNFRLFEALNRLWKVLKRSHKLIKNLLKKKKKKKKHEKQKWHITKTKIILLKILINYYEFSGTEEKSVFIIDLHEIVPKLDDIILTKRNVLIKFIASIFDPLGIALPIMICFKLFMQKVST